MKRWQEDAVRDAAEVVKVENYIKKKYNNRPPNRRPIPPRRKDPDGFVDVYSKQYLDDGFSSNPMKTILTVLFLCVATNVHGQVNDGSLLFCKDGFLSRPIEM